MAIESITKTLGTGSGIDTGALVTSLIEAQYAAKTKQLTTRSDALTAQISTVAKLKSGITGFDSALKSLVKGGTLTTQPTSSNANVVAVSALPGAKLAGFSARVEVTALASAQAATTVAAVSRTAGYPAGNLAIRVGTQTTDADGTPTISPVGATASIDIDAGTTIEGIAAKINATRSTTGLTATVVNDGTGARLTIKGASGAQQAFEIAGTDATDPGNGPSLADLSVGRGAGNTGTKIGATAADANVVIDGATFTRSTNSIADLIPGVQLNLTGVTTTTGAVTLGTSSPSAALAQGVSDFVATYNALLADIKTAIDPVTGPLKADPTATGMARSLAQLTTVPLAAAGTTGAPRTLADLGVATARDGTLSVDTATVTRMLARYPDAVEAMFADSGSGGIATALGAIATRVTGRNAGLDASTTRYTKAKQTVSDAQMTLTEQSAATKTRMTKQFATMDSRVAAYKATQTFLTNQVAAWNKSDS